MNVNHLSLKNLVYRKIIWGCLQVEARARGTSVINFLNEMVEEGVLEYEERSGKGGYHIVYQPKLDEGGFKKAIAESVISSLMRDFPEETNEVLKNIRKV